MATQSTQGFQLTGGARGTKKRSHPRIGTRASSCASWCHPISAPDCVRGPLAFWCGKGTAPVSRPAGSAVFAGAISLGPSQPGARLPGSLSVGRYSGYSCAVMAVNIDMLPQMGKKVKKKGDFIRQRGRGWGSWLHASPGRPGPGRGSAARQWPHCWQRGRSAGRTGA